MRENTKMPSVSFTCQFGLQIWCDRKLHIYYCVVKLNYFNTTHSLTFYECKCCVEVKTIDPIHVQRRPLRQSDKVLSFQVSVCIQRS